MNARSLLDENSWKTDPVRTAQIYIRLAECVHPAYGSLAPFED